MHRIQWSQCWIPRDISFFVLKTDQVHADQHIGAGCGARNFELVQTCTLWVRFANRETRIHRNGFRRPLPRCEGHLSWHVIFATWHWFHLPTLFLLEEVRVRSYSLARAAAFDFNAALQDFRKLPPWHTSTHPTLVLAQSRAPRHTLIATSFSPCFGWRLFALTGKSQWLRELCRPGACWREM
jgi:hypothetical protein